MKKEFIEVVVKYTKDGRKFPLSIIWKDGEIYEVDKVLDVCNAAALKTGGQGTRYKCKIRGQETFLWLEENKWFVEEK